MMALCLRLGVLHPDYLGDMLTSRQMAEWLAYYQISPWDDERADLRAGIITSTLANVNRGKDTEPFQAVDFMPYTKRPDKVLTIEEKKAVIAGWLGGGKKQAAGA